MSDHTNAELIEEARDFVQLGSGINIVEADRLIEELSSELEASEQERDAALAVIEKVRRVGTKTPELIDILATAPADALREIKAEVWDEAFAAGVNHDIGDWENAPELIQNPYREEQS